MQIIQEKATREELIKELAKLRSQLVEEKKKCRRLSDKIARLFSLLPVLPERLVAEQRQDEITSIEGFFDENEVPYDFQALKRLSQFPEENPNPVMRCGSEGTLWYANGPARQWLDTLEWQKGTALPDAVKSLVVAAAGKRRAIEREITNSTGLTVNLFAVQPVGESYVNIYGINITDRKRVERSLRGKEKSHRQLAKALKEERNKLNAVIEDLPVGVGISDPFGTTLFLNKAGLKLHGFTSKEEMFETPDQYTRHFQLFYSDGREMSAAKWPLARAMRGEYVRNYELILKKHATDSKRYLAYSVAPVTNDQSNTTLIVYVIQDLTEQKQVEEALRQSEIKFRQLAESMPQLVWTTGPDGRLDYYNQRYKEYRGIQRKADGTSKWAPVLHQEDVARTAAAWQHAFKTGQIYQIEHRVQRMDGSYHWHLSRALPMRDEKERIVKWFGTSTDIHSLKQMETERLEIERRAQQIAKAESLSRMAGAVAHHFNNMLAAVMGNLELLREDLPINATLEKNLYEAEQALRRAAGMSKLMLAFLGQSKGCPEVIDFSETCCKYLEYLKEDIPIGIQLEANLSPPGPAVKADVTQIGQILSNLITNAWEALNASPGVVRVAIDEVNCQTIATAYRFPMDWEPSATAYVCLTVSDTGRGIPAGNIPRIFDPFYSEKFTGRGLGLAVALGFIKSYGGCITVSSVLGCGTTMRVYLPRSAEAIPVSMKPIRGVLQTFGKNATVLLVEDQKMVRQVVEAMLKRLGFQVIAAKDGLEALEIFREQGGSIRLVLSDLTMPRMDGWQTLAALRRIRPDIPVILASGYDQSMAMEGEHSEQPQAFLAKPYQLEALKAAVNQALGVLALAESG